MTSQHILVVDDEPEIRNSVRDILEDEGFEVSLAEDAKTAREKRQQHSPDLVLLDIWMPGEDGVTLLKDWKENEGLDFPVVMMSGHGTVETAVEATRLGAYDFIEKPLSLAKLLRVTNQALQSQRADTGPTQSDRQRVPLLDPVGSSAVMQQFRGECARAAQHGAWVLFLGESGVGKAFAARYLHALSPNAEQPFVEVSAATLAELGTAEELFGVEGSETPGLIEQAGKGTLFFNQIADLDLQSQSVVLAMLEKKSFTRVGASRQSSLQARIVASSQVDLHRRVKEGLFREDLFYHLNVLPMRILPLREHAEDIPELLKFYVDYFNTQENLPYRQFTLGAQNYLRYYSWPGNIRQLRNLIQRLLILDDKSEIEQAEVEEALVRDRLARAHLTAGLPKEVMELPLREAREIFEREYLSRQLELCRGNVSRLAERVGMERTHLYRKMRTLGISPKKN